MESGWRWLVRFPKRAAPLIRAYIQSLGISTKTEATLIGTSMKSAVSFAALAELALSIHAEDYDDTQLSSAPRPRLRIAHASHRSRAFRRVLAVAESKGVAGRDLVLAYHLGVEVECKIAEAIAPRHYQDGFHTTGTCGTFGSVVAAMEGCAARIAATLARAIGIAASESARASRELRHHDQAVSRRVAAAESGIIAADMADSSMAGPRAARFWKRPTASSMPKAADTTRARSRWESPGRFSHRGFSIKPFPSGSLTHPGMTALQKLIR